MNVTRRNFIASAIAGGAITLNAESVEALIQPIETNNKVNSFICKFCGFDIIPYDLEIQRSDYDKKLKRTGIKISFMPKDMKVYEGYWQEAKDEHEDPWASYSIKELGYTPKQSLIFEHPSFLYIDFINKVHIFEKLRINKGMIIRRQYDNRPTIYNFYYFDYDKEHQKIIKSLTEFKEYHKI